VVLAAGVPFPVVPVVLAAGAPFPVVPVVLAAGAPFPVVPVVLAVPGVQEAEGSLRLLASPGRETRAGARTVSSTR
jgi:hypothetical protein